MKKTLVILAIPALLYSCSYKASETDTNAASLVVASDTATVKYQCPMKCQGDTAYTTQGNCPVCGMELKLVEES